MGSRWRELPAWVRDSAAALCVALVWFGGVALVSRAGIGWSSYNRTWVVAGIATTLAVALSRRFPRTTLAAACLIYPFGYSASGAYLVSEFHILPVLVVGFIVTATGGVRTRWALGASLLAVAALTGALPVITAVISKLGRGGNFGLPSPADVPNLLNDPAGTAFALGATVAIVLLGGSMARTRRTADLLAVRNAELMQLREMESYQVVAAERTRIARELHDIVAHHVSAIVIRAQAAERVADQDPGAPRAATQWIASTGQDALTAMRQVVRVLRKDEPNAARAPEEGLAGLHAITERVGAAGLEVRVRVDDSVMPLAAHVQLAAVRIIQEALTNILIHARARSADVQLGPVEGGIIISVDDDGTAGDSPQAQLARRPGSPTGHGLVGMRERAQSCGGWLKLSTGPRGGWCVTALLRTGGV